MAILKMKTIYTLSLEKYEGSDKRKKKKSITMIKNNNNAH